MSYEPIDPLFIQQLAKSELFSQESLDAIKFEWQSQIAEIEQQTANQIAMLVDELDTITSRLRTVLTAMGDTLNLTPDDCALDTEDLKSKIRTAVSAQTVLTESALIEDNIGDAVARMDAYINDRIAAEMCELKEDFVSKRAVNESVELRVQDAVDDIHEQLASGFHASQMAYIQHLATEMLCKAAGEQFPDIVKMLADRFGSNQGEQPAEPAMDPVFPEPDPTLCAQDEDPIFTVKTPKALFECAQILESKKGRLAT